MVAVYRVPNPPPPPTPIIIELSLGEAKALFKVVELMRYDGSNEHKIVASIIDTLRTYVS